MSFKINPFDIRMPNMSESPQAAENMNQDALFDLDITIKEKIPTNTLGPQSHGCTINATCEGCRQTDDCQFTHYCATQNRCGHTDAC